MLLNQVDECCKNFMVFNSIRDLLFVQFNKCSNQLDSAQSQKTKWSYLFEV